MSMEIALRFHNDDKTQDQFSNLHIKLMSTWSDCITTATIAEESSTWEFESSPEEESNEINAEMTNTNDSKQDNDTEELTTPRLPDNSQVAM